MTRVNSHNGCAIDESTVNIVLVITDIINKIITTLINNKDWSEWVKYNDPPSTV